MKKTAPDAMELAPRDIVARAIDTEVLEGRGFENAYVNLDLTHLGAERIKERLPGIREISIYFAGVDPIEEPIPVQPGQHYSMGGIGTKYNGDYGETELTGLYTIGENSCLSVHGANRLGGNSLLETSVFGRYIGRTLLEKGLPKRNPSKDIKEAEEDTLKSVEKLLKNWENNTGKKPVEIRNDMGNILNKKVGVFRNHDDLEEAFNTIRRLQKDFQNIHVATEDRRFNYGLLRALELRSMIDIAEATAYAALWRKESRGAHFRRDYPKRNDNDYLMHTMIYRENGGLIIKTKPVMLGIFEVKERKY
jgi:succinate dehydrogenase / fumarate reductase flavoprotein subunit